MTLDAVFLRNAFVRVAFGAGGLPSGYQLMGSLTGSHERFGAALEGELPVARVCRLSPRAYADATLKPVRAIAGYAVMSFDFQVLWEGREAARFTLRYQLDRAQLKVTLQDVCECDGYELIQVTLPTLCSLAGGGQNWLAHCRHGGSVQAIADAVPGELPEHPYFGRILHILPLLMLGAEGAVCTMEVTAYMDGALMRVERNGGRATAHMGTIQAHRVDGSSWCNANDDQLTRVYGNDATPNLPVGQQPCCRLDFAKLQGTTPGWLQGSLFVQRRMPKIPTDYYDDKFMYVIKADHPGLESALFPCGQAQELVGRLARVTAFAPQVAYLTGWQVEGMDTGYPAYDRIGERIGGRDGFLALKDAAEKVNCNLSLHDNFDDAYRESDAWDERMIARLPDGSLWRSRNWTRDVSYVQGLAKYMTLGPGRARVEGAARLYKLRNTTHVDVLSWFAIRNDWDPDCPASGIVNLYEGRYRIFDDFKRHGLDLTSESLRYPWLGRIAASCNEPDLWGECPFGGQRVPIVPTVYRKSLIHGGANAQDLTKRALDLLYNVHTLMWDPWTYGLEEEVDRLTETFYLHYVPWFLTSALNTLDYRRDGDWETLTLERDSAIVVNEPEERYRVRYQGHEIMRDGAVFAPLGIDKLAFYALQEGPLRCALPAGWDPGALRAYSLYPDRWEQAAFELHEGAVCVHVRPRVPVVVFHGEPMTEEVDLCKR